MPTVIVPKKEEHNSDGSENHIPGRAEYDSNMQAREFAVIRARWRQVRVGILSCILIGTIFFLGGFVHNFIPSESMEPNIAPGDHILTMRSWLAYPLGGYPRRGDVIVFRLPEKQLEEGQVGYDDSGPAEAATSHTEKPPYTILIKRVIGLPGDRVQLKGNHVYINGKPLKEDYLVRPIDDPDEQDYAYAWDEPLVVGPGQIFVLGDNRNSSDDGRFWGTLKRDDVIGKYMGVIYNEGENGPNLQRKAELNP